MGDLGQQLSGGEKQVSGSMQQRQRFSGHARVDVEHMHEEVPTGTSGMKLLTRLPVRTVVFRYHTNS